jgi:hypothetical protein
MSATATATTYYQHFNCAGKCWSKCMGSWSGEYMYNSVAATKI